MNIKILQLPHAYMTPAYATSGSAGADLFAGNLQDIVLSPGATCVVPTGICMELPVGFEAQVRSRSGLAAKNNIFVLNSPGTIDSDYRGEVKVILHNAGEHSFVIERGMRIAQMVISRFERVSFVFDELSHTERGDGGFGSTGVVGSSAISM